MSAVPADLLTPLAVYLKVAKGEPNSFLLESVEGGESLARYSFIGACPRMIVRTKGETTIIRENGNELVTDKNAIDFLREYFSQNPCAPVPGLPAFPGGAIGYLGFDCASWFEPSLRSLKHEPVAEFMIFNSVIAFDHVKQVIQIVTLTEESGGDFPSEQEGRARNEAIRKLLETSEVPTAMPAQRSDASRTVSNLSQPEFENAVRAIKSHIAAGDCYQAVISQRFERATAASPISIYRAIRTLNPSPYMFLLQMNGRSIIGASPEMLVRCRNKKIEYRPIAGTRPRGENADEDNILAEEMRNDPKEVAEHMMLVDLGRNDIGRVSKYASVKVEQLMEVERYSHVQHLVSRISADLSDGKDCFDSLGACFPAGTVSGAPKIRAIEIVRELEPDDRGVYAGAVGYFDHYGNLDSCIAIRTIELENGTAKVQAGAGIVADSVPESEYLETVNKAYAMLRAIDIAEGAN